MNQQQTPPMVHMTTALWVLLALTVLAFIPFVWSFRPAKTKRPASRHSRVSWRVLWWRKLAPPEAVRRELAPLEHHLADVARINELFPDDAEEDDHADA